MFFYSVLFFCIISVNTFNQLLLWVVTIAFGALSKHGFSHIASLVTISLEHFCPCCLRNTCNKHKSIHRSAGDAMPNRVDLVEMAGFLSYEVPDASSPERCCSMLQISLSALAPSSAPTRQMLFLMPAIPSVPAALCFAHFWFLYFSISTSPSLVPCA